MDTKIAELRAREHSANATEEFQNRFYRASREMQDQLINDYMGGGRGNTEWRKMLRTVYGIEIERVGQSYRPVESARKKPAKGKKK